MWNNLSSCHWQPTQFFLLHRIKMCELSIWNVSTITKFRIQFRSDFLLVKFSPSHYSLFYRILISFFILSYRFYSSFWFTEYCQMACQVSSTVNFRTKSTGEQKKTFEYTHSSNSWDSIWNFIIVIWMVCTETKGLHKDERVESTHSFIPSLFSNHWKVHFKVCRHFQWLSCRWEASVA